MTVAFSLAMAGRGSNPLRRCKLVRGKQFVLLLARVVHFAELATLTRADRHLQAVLSAPLDRATAVLHVNHVFRAMLRAVAGPAVGVPEVGVLNAAGGRAGLQTKHMRKSENKKSSSNYAGSGYSRKPRQKGGMKLTTR